MRPSPRLPGLALGALLAFRVTGSAEAADAPSAAFPRLLARVPVGNSLADVRVPVHAHLVGADGADYALAFAPAGALAFAAGVRSLAAAASPEEFVVATERRRGARARAAALAEVVLDDGRNVVARADEAQAAALSAAGFDLYRLSAEPMVVRAPAAAPAAAVTFDPSVAALVAGVTEAEAAATAGDLSGEHAATISGNPVTILTRYTSHATQLLWATQYARERFLSYGLSPSFQPWFHGSIADRNVVAELTGTTRPSEIVLVTAHLDDMPPGSLAPGADDDASGATGVLLAAEALAGHRFQRTVRFVLFTGEEQGLYGSAAYASLLSSAGANVVAVLNLDMIGWDGSGAPSLRLHTRIASNPGYAADLAVAETFRSAAAAYVGDALLPIDDPDGITASDHASFWARGWPGILAIEDDVSDFSPWYHTSGDTLSTLNLSYFTSFVKAAVATAAHLAVPASQGTSFYPLVPCRVLDTRDAGRASGLGPPALAPGQARAFVADGVCGIPAEAAAVAVNVTAVEPAAAGFVTLYPGRGTAPVASVVHFSPGRIRASSSILPLAPGAVFSALNASSGSLHLVVDVVGVFR